VGSREIAAGIFQIIGMTPATTILHRNDDQKNSETATWPKEYRIVLVALNSANRRHPETRNFEVDIAVENLA
jgi:hypothetical protein